MKTLYVSDLDGTLLNIKEKLSDFSVGTINSLVNAGMIFSYATARSYVTASKVTAGLNANFPAIIYNGAFIINNMTKEILLSNYFSSSEVRYIKSVLKENNIFPIAYAFIDGVEKFSYCPRFMNEGKKFHLDGRKDDIRRLERDNPDDVYLGDLFYFSCIGNENELSPIYNLFKNDIRFYSVYQKDIYSGKPWLEILPAQATKANAALRLKEYLSCDRIISFGDGNNDISLFEISDECYAVGNAATALKEKATAVIDTNDNDGVAKWLQAHFWQNSIEQA